MHLYYLHRKCKQLKLRKIPQWLEKDKANKVTEWIWQKYQKIEQIQQNPNQIENGAFNEEKKRTTYLLFQK